MTKKDVVCRISETSGMSCKDVNTVLNSFFEAVGDSLASGQKVQILGFGIFETRKRAARMGKNPNTGETITIKAAVTPAFRAGKALKDKVNA